MIRDLTLLIVLGTILACGSNHKDSSDDETTADVVKEPGPPEEKQEESVNKWKLQRAIAIKTLYKVLGSYEKVSEAIKEAGFRLGKSQIGLICAEKT